jgi:tripeptidyl-peptidase-1
MESFSVVRSPDFYIPSEISEYVDFIGPSTRFPQPQLLRKTSPITSVANAAQVTPSFLRTLYNLGDFTSTNPHNQQSVTGFLEQYISLNDLAKFFSTYDKPSVGRVPNIVGPNKPLLEGVEASLDIQYVMAMGHGINTTFWSTAGRQPNNTENEPFLVWLYDVANATMPPPVFSISYGDNEDTVDFSYAVRCNVEFQKAGARGITIMASSGDGGVAGSQSTPCKVFIPTFPAASPWITAVGATYSSNPERAAGFSSGGFSDRWTPNSYQMPFISQYFKVASNLPNAQLFNATGAGFPDVAAQGVDFVVVVRGVGEGVSGTSCSSPTFAGIVASLNEIRLNAQKPTLGFLNPLIYSNPNAFNDITVGNNPGCNTKGFFAASGWDPVTGLGTPDFAKLQTVVQNLN